MKPTHEDNEYHLIFQGDGPYTLEVFQDERPFGGLPPKCVHATDIMKLIDPASGKFKKALYFDDHLIKIESYSIHPKLKEIRIHVESFK